MDESCIYTQVLLYSCFGKVNAALVKVFGFAHAAKAQPYVCLAIAIAVWRAALVISMLDPQALSV